jgi:phospholipid/cholesterol/gamma-HCH transport system substrate-binding protein
MARSLTWSQLLPGLALVAAGLLGTAAVFKYARVGALRGDTVRVYARTDNVAGLAPGSEVWVGGQKVGLVRTIQFAPPSSDTSLRVVIAADVLDEHQSQIRRDSYAAIHPGGSFVGAPVLMIGVGTAREPGLRDGDTLSSRVQVDLEAVTGRAAASSRDFPAIIANVKLLSTQLGAATSTIGAIITSEDGGREYAALSRRTASLAAQLDGGRGTIGLALGGEVQRRARTAAADLDTLRALLASQQRSLGSFQRDSTLLRSVQGLRDEVSIVRALLNEPRGTAGRALRDSAVRQQIAGAQTELDALVADIKAHPFRYLAF